MHLFKTQQAATNILEDDWDSVVDAYELDVPPSQVEARPILEESPCLKHIREKYSKQAECQDDPLSSPRSQLNHQVQIHLIYNQSMQADIITDPANFNQLQMTRYTMIYDNVPRSLFEKFVQQDCLEHSKCELFKVGQLTQAKNVDGKEDEKDHQELHVEINVKNQNQNTGGFRKDAKNVNEVFKFTCQRYHSYISQIVEFLKNIETQKLVQIKKQEEENFHFLPSTMGLGSKMRGIPKIAGADLQTLMKGKSNINQLDQIFLCEIFKLTQSKQDLIQELSKNVDSSNVFEFLRLAANDSSNNETQHEAYWMIVYIFLKRHCGMDIVGSFSSQKCKKMLRGINLLEYSFQDGHLVYQKIFSKDEPKKIDLQLLKRASKEISADKLQAYMLTNDVHNLTKILRKRSEQGVFSDYPHYYRLVQEGKTLANETEGTDPVKQPDGTFVTPYHGELFAQRMTENGDFVISCKNNDFTVYGQNFVGYVKPNFLGTCFELYNHGFEEVIANQLPQDFLPVRQKLATIEYDSNFFAEKPRSFRVSFHDFIMNDTSITHKFENMQPRYNEARGCYTLNFYGRVQKASARNFQLVQVPLDDDEPDDDIDSEMPLLTHGKISKNEFNLDYRAPFQVLCSFAVSLTAIGKKRVVG